MTGAVLDQPGLWELEPAPPPARRRNHSGLLPPRQPRTKEQREQDCDPRCLVCGRPEESGGLCHPRCSIVCVHTAQPALVEVCIATVRVTARLVIGLPGAQPGRRLAAVDTCPHCGHTHWHSPAHGLRYRIAGCGKPYLVWLPRPRITAGGTA